MKFLFFGNREWRQPGPIRRELERLHAIYGPSILIHGGNGKRDMFGEVERGADLMANDIARELGWEVQEYPAQWWRGDWAGPVRNEQMKRERPDEGIGFGQLKRGEKWTGTHDMLCRLNAGRVRVTLIPEER